MEDTDEDTMGLLACIGAKAGCTYLSDLRVELSGMRQKNFLHVIHGVLSEIDAGHFSVQEWNDAVKYITGESVTFENSRQAWEYLENYTKQED